MTHDPTGFAAPLGLPELKRLRAALDEDQSGRPFVVHRVEDQVMRAYLDEQIAAIQRGPDGQDPTTSPT